MTSGLGGVYETISMNVIWHQKISTELTLQYQKVRAETEAICDPLETEDYVVQPIAEVSPPKWHLGHTTWFFETFILKPYVPGYREFNSGFNFVFNSYYESLGSRIIRTDRGNLSRPTVKAVYQYRQYVDEAMQNFLKGDCSSNGMAALITLGVNHEQQHQELLWTDIKYILGHNPLFPAYAAQGPLLSAQINGNDGFIAIDGGVYEIGFKGEGFSWDNEHNLHKVYLNAYEISAGLVTNREYLE